MTLASSEMSTKRSRLPKGWATAPFAEIYELLYGKSLVDRSRNPDGPYPVYGSSGIVGYHDAFLVEGPALVVGRKGAAGVVYLASKNFWPIDTTYYIRVNEHLDLRFSYYLLTSLRLGQFERSTAIPGLSRDDAYNLTIWLPPQNEQRRIAAKIEELFSELDNAIANLTNARDQLGVYRQAVLINAFTGALTKKWRQENRSRIASSTEILDRFRERRDTLHQNAVKLWKIALSEWEGAGRRGTRPRKPTAPPKLVLPTDKELEGLPTLPGGWTWIKVHDVLLDSLSNGRSVKDRASGFPVLRLTAIKSRGIDLSEKKNGDWERSDALPYLVKDGDFMVARGNGSKSLVGRGGLVPPVKDEVAYPDTMIRLRVDHELIAASFFAQVWDSHLLRQQIERVARTTAGIYKINQGHILNFVLPLCSCEEQYRIVRAVEHALSICDQMLDEIDQQLRKADALRHSILIRAFSGMLVAQDSSDEPASILLERIKADKQKAVDLGRKKKALKKRKSAA
jgi:type I restriction enzyme, S subunit